MSLYSYTAFQLAAYGLSKLNLVNALGLRLCTLLQKRKKVPVDCPETTEGRGTILPGGRLKPAISFAVSPTHQPTRYSGYCLLITTLVHHVVIQALLLNWEI